jgi:pyruvate formate lyase activating enzyme
MANCHRPESAPYSALHPQSSPPQIVREQLEVADFEKIGELVKGAKRFALQHFRTGTTISPKFANYHTFTDEEFRVAKKIMERYVEECVIH